MNGTTRAVASTFGVLAGLIGIVYGCFEILQGNVATSSLMIDAIGSVNPMWHGGPAAAVTLIPNLFITGILAVSVSLISIFWAIAYIQTKRGWVVWILLAIVQVLVGGGVAQIMLIPLVGVVASQINASLTWRSAHLSVRIRQLIARQWLWTLILSAFLYFLHYAIPIMMGLTEPSWGMNHPELGLLIGYAAIGPFVLAVVAGLARDSLSRTNTY